MICYSWRLEKHFNIFVYIPQNKSKKCHEHRSRNEPYWRYERFSVSRIINQVKAQLDTQFHYPTHWHRMLIIENEFIEYLFTLFPKK